MSASLFDGDPPRKTELFDSIVMREAQEEMECMANVLEASTVYCILGQDLEGTIRLWNVGARRRPPMQKLLHRSAARRGRHQAGAAPGQSDQLRVDSAP